MRESGSWGASIEPRRKRLGKKVVFDAGSLALRFAGDRRVREFFDGVSEGRFQGLISGVNLSEFYYKTCQKLGKQTADAWYFQAIESGLDVAHGEELDRLAGLEKCRGSPVLALADCFALALAKSENALLLTTDGELARAAGVRVRHVAP